MPRTSRTWRIAMLFSVTWMAAAAAQVNFVDINPSPGADLSVVGFPG